MDRIEEVKKILDRFTTSRQYGYITPEDKEKAAKEICLLFEPKPDEKEINTVKCQICNQLFGSRDAGIHTGITGHNDWELLLPKVEDDPQAKLFGWFLEHGWLPPEEAKSRDKEYQEKKGVNDEGNKTPNPTT